MHTLVGAHPPEEHGVAALARTGRVHVHVDPVVDRVGDPRVDRRVRPVMDRDERDGTSDARYSGPSSPSNGPWLVVTIGIPKRPEYTGPTSVWSWITSGSQSSRLVRFDHVAELRSGARGDRALCLIERERARHLTGAVPGGVQQDVVARVLQTPRERVENGFGAAVCRRRYGNPWRRDDRDLHLNSSSSYIG